MVFFSRLRHPPRLEKSDIVMILLPALLWGASFLSRKEIIHPRCAETPELCSPATVFFGPDRLSIGRESAKADGLSFTTQNSAGILAFGIPITWSTALLALGQVTPGGWAIAIATDTVILAQASLWNGFLTECVRLVVQRPRPFVYTNPQRFGADPAHYTSFISGHTSFAAAAGLTLVLTLLGRGAPLTLVASSGVLATMLIFLTGLFRVLAGRHFMTDVLAGALGGALIAFFIAWIHRRGAPTRI